MSSQEILAILKENLQIEQSSSRKSEILTVIKIIEEESLYNAILYDFLTIRSVCKLRYIDAYAIPEVRRVFLDCIKNPSLRTDRPTRTSLDIVYALTNHFDIEELKKDPEFIEIVKNLNYEQGERLFGQETIKLFDDPKYYQLFKEKALEDPRFYKLFPYSKQSIVDGTFEKILEYDPESRGLAYEPEDIIVEVLKNTKKTLDINFVLRNLSSYREETQKYIISVPEYAIQLIYLQANTSFEKSYIPVSIESDLVSKNLKIFDEMSYKQKYNYIVNMNDPQIQKYLIQKIKFMDNILSLPNYAKIFLHIKDKDFLLECLLKKDVLEGMNDIDLRKILSELPSEQQRKLYEDKVFKDYFYSISRFDAFMLLGYFDEDIIDELLDSIPNVKISELMSLFESSHNHKYLSKIIDAIKEEELNTNVSEKEELDKTLLSFYRMNIFNSKILRELTNEEFEFFLSRYNDISTLKNALDFVDRITTSNKISTEEYDLIKNIDDKEPLSEEQKNILYQHRQNIVYEKQLKKSLEIIAKEDSRIINRFAYAIFDSVTPEERLMLLNHMTIECLIVLISASDYVVDYVYELYTKDPTIFDNVKELPNTYTSFDGEELSPASITKLVNLFSKLSFDAQEKMFNNALLENQEVRTIIINNLKENPNAYSGNVIRKKLQSLYSKEEYEYLLEQMSVETFLELMSTIPFNSDDIHKEVVSKVTKLRQDEILYKVLHEEDRIFFGYNKDSVIKKILELNTDKEAILDKLDIKELHSLYDSYSNSFNKKENEANIALVFNMLVKKQKELKKLKDKDLKDLLSAHNPSELSKLIEELNINEMIEVFAKTLNKDLEDKLIHEFIKKPYFKNNTDYSLEELLSKLEPSNKEIICNCLDEQFEELEVPLNIKDKLRKVSYDEKIFLIYGTKENVLNEEKYKLISDLLDKDPFAINSLNIDLFEDNIYNISKNVIPKIYRYENLTKSYIDLLKSKNKNSKLMLLLIEYLNKTTPNLDIYAKKLESIINYLSNIDDPNIDNYNLNNITEEELVALEEYICIDVSDHLISNETVLYLYRNSNHGNITGDTFKEISQKRILELDNKMLDDPDIQTAKDCIFKKYFKISEAQVSLILRKYDTSLDKVKHRIKNQTYLEYYNELKNIYNSEDINALKEYYHNQPTTHRIDECLYLYEEFDRVYNESIAENIKGYQNGKHNTISITDEDTTKYVGVIELESDFDLIVHSTDAYGQMEMINDNYFDSWNYSEKTSNHGICASFISNSNLGTANVKGKGVMFGFTKLNGNSISSMAPYDLVSKNDGVITTTRRPPMFTDVDDLADYTRHTHNELVLERRNISEGSEYPVIQPNCLIIFEEMDEKIKQNTLKAQADFKERGIDLPIIYINRKKVAEKEARRVEEMLNIYEQNPNIELLAEIINKYESNRCGEDFEQAFKPEELFNKERIYNAIIKTIEYIKTKNDGTLAKQMISMINHENDKFELIKETVGERAHSFDLLDDRLKQELQELEKSYVETMPEFNTSFAI